MDWMSLVISLISGASAGTQPNLKNFDMGTLWNSVAGIVGRRNRRADCRRAGHRPGGRDGRALGQRRTCGSIVSQIGGGGVGGAILLVVASYLKQMLAKAA